MVAPHVKRRREERARLARLEVEAAHAKVAESKVQAPSAPVAAKPQKASTESAGTTAKPRKASAAKKKAPGLQKKVTKKSEG